jgi:hypothetical protein
MNALTRNPSNPNYLHPNKFTLNFSRLPNTQFFCQVINLPGVSLGEVPRNNPFIDLYSPGEKILYDLLSVTFIVDEDLQTWLEVHNWIRAMTFPTGFDEYANLGNLSQFSNPVNPQFSDAYLTILSSANNPNYRIHFIDCFPTSLSSIIFTSSDSPDSVLTADLTLRFAYYNIEKA